MRTDLREVSFFKDKKKVVFEFENFENIDFWCKNNYPDLVSHKMAIEIGAFVKYFRFAVGTNHDEPFASGLLFIQQNIGTCWNNLPFIYDVVYLEGKLYNDCFVFFRLLHDAHPLDKMILESGSQKKMLFEHLLIALHQLHKKGYWHKDLKEGNVLYSDGSFYLIDLDSVSTSNESISQLDEFRCNKLLSDLVKFHFSEIYNNLNGDELNLLQIVMLFFAYEFRSRINTNVRLPELVNSCHFDQFLLSNGAFNDLRNDCLVKELTAKNRYFWLYDNVNQLINKICR